MLHEGAELEKMGQPGTYMSYGAAWANTCNTPFRLYKHYDQEGGISTPLIIHWPKGSARKAGEIDRQRLGYLGDIMPTCAEVAGAAYPKTLDGKAILPCEGESLLPALRGEPAAQERTLCFEHEGNRAVRQGKWKLVALAGGAWELYDEEADRTEQKNVAAQNAERVKAMAALWEEWAKRCHALPRPALPPLRRGKAKAQGRVND